ncbi:RNA-binding cell elongation regulator Jag/EloR [Bacillus suaedae]|uniref:RNA-binding protein KhpB n=1 Tax=Halalkalibacter suaedae TaxID=2822140 RepID=A0A941ARH1_9BACI|nr:protein jag [Bacillus suaedae]
MKKLTVSGKTIEEAITKALIELDTVRDKITYDVVEEPKKGLFGLFGSKPAVVNVVVLPDPVEKAYSFLLETLTHIGIDSSITKQEEGQTVKFDLTSNGEAARLIGKRGQTLEALEYLTNVVANREAESYLKVELDTENYRERRKQILEKLAIRVAKQVKVTRVPTPLEPMNSSERKLIHSTLQRFAGIRTVSEGKGIKRHIVITPASKKSH